MQTGASFEFVLRRGEEDVIDMSGLWGDVHEAMSDLILVFHRVLGQFSVESDMPMGFGSTRRKGTEWTDEEVKLLIELRSMKKDWHWIAMRLGRTASACQKRYSRYLQKKSEIQQ